METIDRRKMSKLTYPAALQAQSNGAMSAAELRAGIASIAEGYAFPTNLDTDPPKGGLAPETQQAAFLRALDERMSAEKFAELLDQMAAKQLA